MKTRCEWARGNILDVKYHDLEWGVPLHDDRKLFEFLILEGAQAGLRWSTILKKRQGYIQAYNGFHPEEVAQYGPAKVKQLLNNPSIIRNRLKIKASITNARAFLKIRQEFGSFDTYIWQFVDDSPKINAWQRQSQIPAYTPESQGMSVDLKKRGFTFVGPTICYAFMQAVGMVNDHIVACFRYKEILDMCSENG